MRAATSPRRVFHSNAARESTPLLSLSPPLERNDPSAERGDCAEPKLTKLSSRPAPAPAPPGLMAAEAAAATSAALAAAAAAAAAAVLPLLGVMERRHSCRSPRQRTAIAGVLLTAEEEDEDEDEDEEEDEGATSARSVGTRPRPSVGP